MPEHHYPGDELELFRHARRWKAYWTGQIRGELRGDVLEVGAGVGGNAAWLARAPIERLCCIEPDPALAVELRAELAKLELPTEAVVGTLADLDSDRRFDTIIYADVIEHIADDRAEIASAARLVRPGGRLIVLVPAHPSLYSPFDAAIGHHRRYTRASLAAVAPPGLLRERLVNLDSVGMLASFANRFALRRALPTRRQIAVWDRWMVPVSRALDPLAMRRVGKSLLAVWRNRPA